MTRLLTFLNIFTIFWPVYFSFLFPCISFRVHYLLVLMAFKKFSSFDESLQTAIDTFDDFVFHILNIGKCPNTFHKSTETWQKIIMGVFHGIIRSLHKYALIITKKEINRIKEYAAWNRYPRNVVNTIIK